MLGARFFKRRVLTRAEEQRLVAAIRRAEAGNRGEVVVHVERRCRGGDALARAAQLFERLGMRRTAEDTGVLLYVAVRDRRAAVYAGRGVYGAAAPDFWREAIEAVASGFKRGDGVGGLEAAVDRLGDLLRQAIPGEDRAGNELPDAVSQG